MTLIAPEVIELDGLGDSWEELVSTGIELAQHMDLHRWAIGDVGCKVESRYGQNSMGKFADEIGIANAQTFRDYTRVARRFEPATRNAFSGSAITFTHYRTAMRAKDDAELWLARAADESWSVRELNRQIAAAIGKPVPPRKLYEGAGVVWQYADVSRPYLVLHDDVSQLKPMMRVIVKVYAVEEAGNE